jgi:hypothetical protein
MRLDLGQEVALYRQQGRRLFSFAPRDGGEFDVGSFAIKDAEQARTNPDAWKGGRRVWRETHHNLMTNWLREYMSFAAAWTPRVAIFSDRKPMHKFGDFRRTTNPSAGYATFSSWDKDGPAWLWTITGTVLAPAAGKVRNFQTVAICISNPVTWPAGNNSHCVANILAGTLLSTDRDQDETQQVVISYRLAWEVPSNV